MLCHSVRSWRSPVPLSFQESSVAMEKRQNGVPLAVYFNSGSRPRRPTRITLLTDFAIRSCLAFLAPYRTPQFAGFRLRVRGFTGIGKIFHDFVQSGECRLLLV